MTEEVSLMDIQNNLIKEINKVQIQNNNIANQMGDIKNDINGLRSSIETLSIDVSGCKSDIDAIKKKSDHHTEQFKTHKLQQDNIIKSHTELCEKLSKYSAEIEELKKKLNDEIIKTNANENNNRKICIEISGIPANPNQNCKQLAVDVGALMGITLKVSDIDVSHRLFQINKDHIPSIIVKFHSRTDRDWYYSKRSNLKSVTIHDLGMESTTSTRATRDKIFINESLSVFSKQLYKEARDKCKSEHFDSCFTTGGVIYVRHNKESPKIRINCFKDLEKIIRQESDS